jgi:hypothetical protein
MLQYFKYRILLLIDEKPTKTTSYDVPQALVARNCHPPCFNSVYIFIFNKISLSFHLFFLILTYSCPYSYNFMLTATYIYRPYIYILKSYTCSLRVHLMHLISIMSFKLGHELIPKRHTFSPLFLFYAYDSSVLQNFKIFIHLLLRFSHSAF